MRRALLAAVGAALAFTACGGSGEPDAGPPSTATTSTRPATTTTAEATTTSQPQTPLATPRQAVDALLAAWRAGDRASALLVADAAAVDALFAVAPGPAEDRGCNQGGTNPLTYCVFRLDAGELQVRAAARGSGFVVDFAIVTPA